ncbi:uncharacterized protein LOC108903151 [Anoplophora glabripennis]|uniref:uncharacterized protein LOC108903151 n=1 Tax=Anoplophora glabripennis TaxID=217634 RepID=UPI000873725D|nr:uncharacterized protein LOC108903151 [Anoplophora glabripennis]
MVFEMRMKSVKKKPINVRCKSADSGVSVALSKTCDRRTTKSSNSEINDIEEEHLDFEPDFGDGFDNNSQSQSMFESQHIYSGQSTVKDFNLDNEEYINSTFSASESAAVDNYSLSNVSIAHRRDMLPVPHSDAKDGRQYQYLPLCFTPSISGRTTLDSSSEDSINSEIDTNCDVDVQDDNTRDQYTIQSGNRNEETSSVCSITQEEEDRLLDSSGDESQDSSNFEIQTGSVETCQIGNARITLPKFISSSPKQYQTNDLKRNNSTAKLKMFECRKKKKKWDLQFKPEHPISRVFLNDIGYVDVKSEDSDEESQVRNNLPQPQFGSLIVICNKDKITCEEPRANCQREFISLPKNEENNFKLPLPPPKRPPTRPKRTVSNTEGSSTNLQIKFSNKGDDFIRKPSTFVVPQDFSSAGSFQDEHVTGPDKDDTISILASSIGVDNVDDIANLDQLEDMNYGCSDQPNYFETNENPSYIEDRVKQWVQNVPNPQTSPKNIQSMLNSNQTSPRSPLNSNEGGLMPPVSAKGNPRVNFRTIPNVFSGLCFHYYFSANCLKLNCTLAHIVNVERFIHKIQRVDPNEIFKHFQFSMCSEKLFREIYPSFVAAFGKLKMQNELIACIKYFLQMKDIDCTEATDSVVKALGESGLSFQDAIEMISFNIGFLEHPILADILLDLITRTNDISENWAVIKRILKARGKIKPSIVSRIFLRMVNVYPVNKELCREIYNTIVKNNMTDLSKISEDVLIPVRTLVDFQDGTAKSITKPSIPDAQLKALSNPNPQELLAAHIDNKLIKERELYEREVEGTTVRARIDLEPNHPVRNPNYESRRTSSSDNHSQSSGSEERYFQPNPRLSPFAPRDYALPIATIKSRYLRNEFSRTAPSTSNNPFEQDNVDLNTALRFEPPSEVSEYIPENVRVTNRRGEPQEAEISLKPSRPIFGSPCYRSDFNFNKSVHNLLPDSFEHVNINERDVAKLNSVIKSKNGTEFYELLQYYKSPPTLQNFITMTIANLKLSTSSIHDTLISFMQSFESIDPDYTKDKEIKGIMEVIVMNCLFEIEKKGLWNHGRYLLESFCDWDSLVSSKIFSKRRVTHMGRYIFLAKIFSKARNYNFTYEILQCPNLKLLEPPENWPYFKNVLVDLESRNAVLKDFFKYGYRYYNIGVLDIYRRIFKRGGIFGFDAEAYFNPMLIAIIDEQRTDLLKCFHPDIDVYYKVMDKNVLRSFTVIIAEQLSPENQFRLYEFCCELQIYTKFVGGETNITVRNNMFNIELELILNYYFHKISETRRLPAGNLTIHIKLMDNKPLYPKVLQKCIRSIKEINNHVKKILTDCFSIHTIETSCEQLTTIEILYEQLQKWLQCNQRFRFK